MQTLSEAEGVSGESINFNDASKNHIEVWWRCNLFQVLEDEVQVGVDPGEDVRHSLGVNLI